MSKEKIIEFPKGKIMRLAIVREVPEGEIHNKHFSYVDTGFDEAYEKKIRYLTRSFDPAKEAEMGVQDRLVYAFITVNATTGQASEFGWASGRVDSHILVDYPLECVSAEVVQERAALIEKLKEKYHDRGFAHGGSADLDCFVGGFADFARNYQQATGREVAPEIAALCSCKLEQAA